MNKKIIIIIAAILIILIISAMYLRNNEILTMQNIVNDGIKFREIDASKPDEQGYTWENSGWQVSYTGFPEIEAYSNLTKEDAKKIGNLLLARVHNIPFLQKFEFMEIKHDRQKNLWILVYYNPESLSSEGSFQIAINGNEGKILRMWLSATTIDVKFNEIDSSVPNIHGEIWQNRGLSLEQSRFPEVTPFSISGKEEAQKIGNILLGKMREIIRMNEFELMIVEYDPLLNFWIFIYFNPNPFRLGNSYHVAVDGDEGGILRIWVE